MPLLLPKARSDLQFYEQEVDGDTVVIVRDPVRNTFYKYNALQAEMLRSLDGVHTIDQMVQALGEKYETEIPRVAAERFVAHVRKQMLLDVACYGVPEQEVHQKVLRALAKQGFRFRELSTTGANGERIVSGEAVLFMGGLRQLQAGQPKKALDYFNAVLELNPKNERARSLVDTIQQAYVKTMDRMTTNLRTWVIMDPTRLLRFLDRWFGKLLFGWGGALLMVALVGGALYSYFTTDYPDLNVGLFDIVVAAVFSFVHFFFHELGHGFACYHYGGQVNELGLMILYGRPAAYCDTSSTYLFTQRRHLIIVQLAGMLVSAAFTCSLFILLALFTPSFMFYTAAQLLALYSIVLTLFNVIPFLKLDGYYAVCDYLGIPNLRERSINMLKAWASTRLLGIPVETEQVTPERRRLFLWFGGLSIATTVFWIYLGVFRFLAPAVEQFRGPGFIVGVAIILYLIRRWLFLPIWKLLRLVIRERRSVFTWRRSLGFVVLLALAIWPWTIETYVRIDASFVLIPKERVRVRAQVPGIVDQILVKEGETVHKGQLVAVLRNEELEHEVRTLRAQLAEIDARLDELHSGARADEIRLATQQVAVARASQARDAQQAREAYQVARLGLSSQDDALTANATAAVSASLADAAAWKLATVKAGARAEDIDAVAADRARIAAQLSRATADRDLLSLRSSIDGVVITEHLRDHLNEHLGRGDVLLDVYDTSAFVAEVHVPSTAPLDQIAVGDDVVLQARGVPGESIDAQIARIRDTADGAADAPGSAVVLTTTPFVFAAAPAGLEGHARLYGKRRSLAYSMLYLPLRRIVSVDLWSRT